MAYKIDIFIDDICKKYLSPISFWKHDISCDIIAPSLINRIQIGRASSLFYLKSALGRLDIHGVLHGTSDNITIKSHPMPTSAVGYESLQDGLSLSSLAHECAASYLPKDDVNISIPMKSAIQILVGRYRVLNEMDQSSLSVFDAETLNNVDFISY